MKHDAEPEKLFSDPPYDERHDRRYWEKIYNGVIEEDFGDMVWTNRSCAFLAEEGEELLTNQRQHKLLKRAYAFDRLCKVQWA